MDMNDYQNKALREAESGRALPLLVAPDLQVGRVCPLPYVYPAMGLAGEAGEVLDKVKKVIRDRAGMVSEEDRMLICAELGDVLWYLGVLAASLGITLEEVAQSNLRKLEDRKARDVIQGSGDTR